MTLRFPKPGPAAGLGGPTPGRAQSGQERVKGAKMAGLFCSPRRHAEACPLPPGPRSRFRRPRWHPARRSLLPWSRSLANLLDPGAAGRPARSFRAAAGPSTSRSVCGPGRRLVTTVAAAPLFPSRPPRAFPAAQRAEAVRWAWQHCPPVDSMPNSMRGTLKTCLCPPGELGSNSWGSAL